MLAGIPAQAAAPMVGIAEEGLGHVNMLTNWAVPDELLAE